MSAASNSARTSAPPPDDQKTIESDAAGSLLRSWRLRRGLSRADLAVAAGIADRRLGLVESGKARAGRPLLLALARALDLPFRDRNALLQAAGLATLYIESDLSAPEMGEARRAVTLLLSRSEPFPALITDRHWTVLAANDAARRLIGLMLGEARMARPLNLMAMFLGPDELRRHIVNWPAVAAALLRRARREAMAAPRDGTLQAIWRGLLADPEVAALAAREGDLPPGPLGEVRFAAQGREIGLIGTVAALAAPQDITLEELRIEAFLPADEASEDILYRMAGLA